MLQSLFGQLKKNLGYFYSIIWSHWALKHKFLVHIRAACAAPSDSHSAQKLLQNLTLRVRQLMQVFSFTVQKGRHRHAANQMSMSQQFRHGPADESIPAALTKGRPAGCFPSPPLKMRLEFDCCRNERQEINCCSTESASGGKKKSTGIELKSAH